VYISFDSHIPEIYERIRVGAKYEKVLGNIKEILQVAAEEKTPLGFVVVLMAENADHLPDYIDFIADIGGTEARAEIRIQRMHHLSSQCKDQEVNVRYTTEQLHGIFNRVMERAMSRKIIMLSELEAPFNGILSPVSPYVRGVSGDVLIQIIETIKERYPHFCSMASHYLKINPNGSVYPCCRAPGELIMGNALETSVQEIWNGEKFKRFRRSMHSGDYPECCSTCDVLIDNPHFKKMQQENG
jgi:radical SAM protein with 4Fe4S-binding SPASM domain